LRQLPPLHIRWIRPWQQRRHPPPRLPRRAGQWTAGLNSRTGVHEKLVLQTIETLLPIMFVGTRGTRSALLRLALAAVSSSWVETVARASRGSTPTTSVTQLLILLHLHLVDHLQCYPASNLIGLVCSNISRDFSTYSQQRKLMFDHPDS
jgi:hypothetical protein